MKSSEIVKEYLVKFPKTPSHVLARMIYSENKAVWTNTESVRALIRYYRGQNGNTCREAIRDKAYIAAAGQLNPFDELPEGLTEYGDWESIELDGKRFLLLADCHIPYHNKTALGVALEHGKSRDVDTILILGDFMDFYSCSFWGNDPRRRNFRQELEAVRQILGIMREQFPKARIVYKLGNHEERYDRYMRVKAPELLGVAEYDFSNIIHADKYGIEIVGEKRIVKIGRLHCIHGHEFWRGVTNPVNPARGLYMRGKEIAVCAHYHQTSQHTEKSLCDVITSCWSIGALCDMHPEYCPINKWNYGFAYVENTDEFTLNNHKIIHGKVY
jgi:predicted phosphodiesterase